MVVVVRAGAGDAAVAAEAAAPAEDAVARENRGALSIVGVVFSAGPLWGAGDSMVGSWSPAMGGTYELKTICITSADAWEPHENMMEPRRCLLPFPRARGRSCPSRIRNCFTYVLKQIILST